MSSKKYLIFLMALFVIIFSFFSVLRYLFPSWSIPTGMAELSSPLKEENDVYFAAKNSVLNKEKTILNLGKGNTCYWIKSNMNKTNYFLEIIEYEYPTGMKGCFGVSKSIKQITLDKPINLREITLREITCLCDETTYQLEWKNEGLTVIKLTKPSSTS